MVESGAWAKWQNGTINIYDEFNVSLGSGGRRRHPSSSPCAVIVRLVRRRSCTVCSARLFDLLTLNGIVELAFVTSLAITGVCGTTLVNVVLARHPWVTVLCDRVVLWRVGVSTQLYCPRRVGVWHSTVGLSCSTLIALVMMSEYGT